MEKAAACLNWFVMFTLRHTGLEKQMHTVTKHFISVLLSAYHSLPTLYLEQQCFQSTDVCVCVSARMNMPYVMRVNCR